MILELKDISQAKRVSLSDLKVVEVELTQKEIEYFDRSGWDKYRKEDFLATHLPEISTPVFFKSGGDKVIEIFGKRYKFSFRDSRPEYFDVEGKSISLEPTEEPLSPPDDILGPVYRSQYWYKFFGQPTWIQGTYYPADLNGRPCSHLVTIENGWGDAGNYNILIGFDENRVPNVAFFNADCC